MLYDIGLDFGTNSLGWAVVDAKGEICQYKKQPLRGSIIDFNGTDKKNHAAERSFFRRKRRNECRTEQRVKWLQELMEPLVAESDPLFFKKMKYSFLSPADSNFDIGNELHRERGASLNYRNEYPTIYHLRKALITGGRMDIRLVYLAMHHILTNRGSFNYEGKKLSLKNFSILESVENLVEKLSFDTEFLDCVNIVDVLESDVPSNDKKNILYAYLENFFSTGNENLATKTARKAYLTAVVSLVMGYSADFSKINGSDDKIPVNLSDDDLSSLDLNDEDLALLEAFSSVYSGYVIINLLKGSRAETISDCYINRYEIHGLELQLLKRVIRKYIPEHYYTMINNTKVLDHTGKVEYVSYALYIKKPGKYRLEGKGSLYQSIEKLLLDNSCIKLDEGDADIAYMRNHIEDGSFLKKPCTSDNRPIPYQFHMEELSMIIDNQSRFYPGLKEIREKILSICSFRIPYFVGPLQPSSPFAWLKRTNEKITPWNFEEVVDLDESERRFIRRQTGKCNELIDEDVLPRCSPIYDRYTVLNELSDVKINGKNIPAEVKRKVCDDLFLRYKTVSVNAFATWLYSEGFIADENVAVSGLSDEKKFLAHRSFEIDTRKILGNLWNSDMVEELAEIITIFSSSNRMARYIHERYPEISEAQAGRLSKLNYSGWGKLSRKLLVEMPTSDGRTIMELLESTELNYMAIRFDSRFGVIKAIETVNEGKLDGISISDFIFDYPVTPVAKHMAFVTYKAVMELIDIMGGELPRSVYIETADGEDALTKEASTSRYDNLMKLYKKLIDDSEYVSSYEELRIQGGINKNLTLKQTLYFLQNGKSLYSGKSFGGIGNLGDCEIDHIIPQCYIKDNSLDNLALVFIHENQRKADSKLLDGAIIQRMLPKWTDMASRSLMSKKKLENLARTSVTDDDMKGFIRRQLVDTGQATKLVMRVLNMLGIKQVYGVSAKLTSNIRLRYSMKYKSLIKIRELNDCHHADDAYIAARVGHFVQKVLFAVHDNILMQAYRGMIHDSDSRFARYGLLAELFGQKISLWNGHVQLYRMCENLNGKSYFIRYNTIENTGAFYKRNILPKGEGTVSISDSKADIAIYGGYSGEKDSYFVMVEDSRGRRKLAGIPIRIAAFKSDDKVREYLEERNLKLISSRKILKYQEVKYMEDSGRISHYLIVGDREVLNARQLYVDDSTLCMIRNLLYGNLSEDEIRLMARPVFENLLKHLSTYSCYEEIYDGLLSASDKFDDMSPNDQVNLIRCLLKAMKANSCRVERPEWKIASIRSSRMERKNLYLERLRFVDRSVTGVRYHLTKAIQ